MFSDIAASNYFNKIIRRLVIFSLSSSSLNCIVDMNDVHLKTNYELSTSFKTDQLSTDKIMQPSSRLLSAFAMVTSV